MNWLFKWREHDNRDRHLILVLPDNFSKKINLVSFKTRIKIRACSPKTFKLGFLFNIEFQFRASHLGSLQLFIDIQDYTFSPFFGGISITYIQLVKLNGWPASLLLASAKQNDLCDLMNLNLKGTFESLHGVDHIRQTRTIVNVRVQSSKNLFLGGGVLAQKRTIVVVSTFRTVFSVRFQKKTRLPNLCFIYCKWDKSE